MKKIFWNTLDKKTKEVLTQRPFVKDEPALDESVRNIIEDVKKNKDAAIKCLTKQYDGVDLDEVTVEPSLIQDSGKNLDASTKASLAQAFDNIQKFHMAQISEDLKVEIGPGIVCEKQKRPIQRIGLYVPGGSAPLPSTVLMLGVPSMIAGCKERILCTPPQKDGTINPVILYAAKICGIKKVYKVGGAQAIAAMAYGTQSIPKVDKIYGPGNRWVTKAKQIVALDPLGAGLDMPAGPSEVMVIADETANPKFVAADLLAQAEHGIDSQVVLICMSNTFAKETLAQINQLMTRIKRQNIASKALENSFIAIMDNLNDAIEFANEYAPEHLILQCCDASQYIKDIQAAGSVFVGPWSPETVGDYASGTNHVLPTYASARNASGLSLNDFVVEISIQTLTKEGLTSLKKTVNTLSQLEGLDAHQLAVNVRFEEEQ